MTSGLIELVTGDLVAHGKLALNLPSARELQTWGLTIGITDASLGDAGRYLPETLSEDVLASTLRALLRITASIRIDRFFLRFLR